MADSKPPNRLQGSGFTLVEVLVAVAVLAVLTLMAWQAVDALSRTERITRDRGNALSALQAGLAQWATDLDAAFEGGTLPAFDHNGRTTRLVRSHPTDGVHQSAGVQVVAWTVRDGHWWRWASPAVAHTQALQQAWDAAERWGQRPSDADQALHTAVVPANQWQVYVYRDGTWSNPLSSATATGQKPNPLPDGVRLVLGTAPPLPLVGDLVRDWARPTRGGGKS